MTISNSLLDGEYSSDQLVYDGIVIGTGTSSEPVIYHLSKTNLKILIIDGSDFTKNIKVLVILKENMIFKLSKANIFRFKNS